jgi:hypothetical protein
VVVGNWRRWIAIIGLLYVLLGLVVVVIGFSAGLPPGPAEETKLADYVTKSSGTLLAVVFVSGIGLALYLIFASGLRSILRSAAEYEWAAALYFGSALLVIAVTASSLSILGGAAIDTGGKVNPAAVRALNDASLVVGWITAFPAAVGIGTVAFATARSGVLAGWTVWVGYVAAFITAVSTLTIFGGADPSNFFSVNGIGSFLLGFIPSLIWVLCISIALWQPPAAATSQMRARA